MDTAPNHKCADGTAGRLTVAITTIAIACMCLAAIATEAKAAFGFADFAAEITADADGSPAVLAGSHPHQITTHFEVNTVPGPKGVVLPDGQLKDLHVNLPVGLSGSQSAVPRCTLAVFNANFPSASNCPNDTAVGYIRVGITGNNPQAPIGYQWAPLYNLTPAPGKAARFGFRIITANVMFNVDVRTGSDYGLEVSSPNTPQALRILVADLVIWGVPAADVHDGKRGKCIGGGGPTGESCPIDRQPVPFLTMPTSCSESFVTTIRANSWQEPANWQEAAYASQDSEGFPLGVTGCEDLQFKPTFEVESARAAGSATGLRMHLGIPQDLSAAGRATSHLRKAVATLPEGVTVNPAVANGLAACSPAQIGLDNDAPIACPDSSKLGSVEIVSPELVEPVKGAMYLARQNDNPFGSTLAMYLAGEGSGVRLKLAGRIDTDPVTGQITTTFDGTPQLPFSDLTIDLFGGPNGVLIAPQSCGTYTATMALTPWSGTGTVTRSDSFTIDSGPGGGPCPNGGFDPKLTAGTTNPVGGQFSPFTLQVSREDGTRTLQAIDVTLPPGVLAKLAGVPYCPDAALAAIPTALGTGAGQAAAPSCPAASQVGTVSVGAGAGSNPVYVPGKVYLAGPYKGAPLSLAFVTPAIAGPLDLGNVVVRSALHLDPETARVRAVSDPLPTILAGIPLNLRDVRVNLDRDGFTLNPTSCDPMGITGQIAGAGGVVADVSQRFQAASCAALGFKPRLSLRLKGKTNRSAHPALTATVKARKGDANIGRAVVTLPKTQFLEQDHIRTICTRVQYAAENCPKASVYGFAKAWTPLLDQPLQGPVYLRSSDNELPDLVADLNGQIEIDLAGRIDSVNSRMRTTFASVPDAPVSKFVLKMQGGKKGLLVNNTELCNAKPRAKAAFTGQNGKRLVTNPLVKIGCGKKKQKRR